MSRLFLFMLLCAMAPAMAQLAKQDGPPAAATKLSVDVQRSEIDGQHLYDVRASGTVRATPAAVWKVLTDYDRMHEFVPDLASCKLIARNGNEAIIEQIGTARFLFVSKSIHLIVRAQETPLSAIDIALISGDMKQYEARWELVPLPDTGGTALRYRGKMMPDFYVPGMLGAAMVRSDVARMMAAVLARLDSQPDVATAGMPPANGTQASTAHAK